PTLLRTGALALALLAAFPLGVAAQEGNSGQDAGAPAGQEPGPPAGQDQTVDASDFYERLPESEALVFSFQNRDIVEFRARVLGRDPAGRAATATRRLNAAIERGGARELTVVPFDVAMLVNIDGETVLALVPEDLDASDSTSLELEARLVAARLRVAVNEAVELRDPARLLRALIVSAVASIFFFALI
ncbi:MAG: hypothetical protein GWO02_09255, partial [Gammaproteobacteria bacterium]|nr:hypothetical protein [Gammaproteobacteria bacterium]